MIAKNTHGISSTFTVRKIGANAVAIERILPHFSPLIDSIKVIRRGESRSREIVLLKRRVGKAARVKEKVVSKTAA